MIGQHPHYFLGEVLLWFIYMQCYHRANNRGKYGDIFYNSMVDDKDSHIPSPQIMNTCTAWRYTLLVWQKMKGVHPNASKSKLKAGRPDHSHYLNYKNDGGQNESYCPATCRMPLTSPGIADTYTFLMNAWNTLPESFQQRVYENTLATVKRQIQQVEDHTPAMVMSVEAAHVDIAILFNYLTFEVALEEPEIENHWPNHPARQQLHEWQTACQDARGRRGL